MQIPQEQISAQIETALAEDIGSGDVTAALIPEDLNIHAMVISREAAVLCGCTWFEEVFRQLAPAITIDWHAQDAEPINSGQRICNLSGPARPLLSGERTALNFLQTLSGTASLARRYVDAIADLPARILDTRKTLPGLRLAQKYAVHCGGACNHRLGLYDAILIKENHILAAGSIAAAISQARKLAPELPLEVEVENPDQLQQALAAGATRLLLDNMDPEQLRHCVSLNNGQATLEASGNVSLETIRQIAATGVDFISVGSLTKHLHAIDFSMLFTEI